jgi:hypothetical protein
MHIYAIFVFVFQEQHCCDVSVRLGVGRSSSGLVASPSSDATHYFLR